MPSHKIVQNWERVGANESVVGEKTVTAELEINADIAFAQNASNAASSLAIDVSALKSLFIKSTTPITLETNNATTPDDSFSLEADEPLVWHEDSPYACPLGTDVTQIFITEPNTAAGTLTIRALIDPNP